MAYYPDLTRLDYFPVGETVILKAVGWLGVGQDFKTGRVSQSFFERLQELIGSAWQPFHSIGVHNCELCQFAKYEHTPCGNRNLFVPFDGAILVAPELILHYVNAHHYLPPQLFIDAVMQSPEIRSMAYKRALLANGGRGLSKPPDR